MLKLTPIVRISIGLALLTISILLAADAIFGISRARLDATLDARKKLAESLAVQFSVLASKSDTDSIKATMQALTIRNDDVVSMALKDAKGAVLARVGDHEQHWAKASEEGSTPTHIQVTLFEGSRRWGRLEVGFTPLSRSGFAQFFRHPLVQLVFFIGIIGFAAYFVFLRRTLAHLDPASVIPERVKLAFNALSEGVVLMDESGRIVLANSAFEQRVGAPTGSLLGRKLSDLDWTAPGSNQAVTSVPWNDVIKDGKSQIGVSMSLTDDKQVAHAFMVNASPITDERGAVRGVLTTFDDVTELEKKNEELENMLKMLDASRGEVRRQNEKLQILATRDTLTNCLNRRSFFDQLEREFENARADELPLSCIMADIDHFKAVNDNYGHAVGDKVIREIADVLRMGLRSIDLLGRYGGEEFCIVLPGVNALKSMEIAERLRSLAAAKYSARSSVFDRPVTLSFGVASLEFGATDASQLIDQADKALYTSKNNGRNRVTCWSEIDTNDVAVG